MLSEDNFTKLLDKVFLNFSREEHASFKERETIAGKRFLLTAQPGTLTHATFINLDFSFRERVLHPAKSTFDTTYPITFTSFIHHLSADEICAEKVRALLTRNKGRDFFDLWFLTETLRVEPDSATLSTIRIKKISTSLENGLR